MDLLKLYRDNLLQSCQDAVARLGSLSICDEDALHDADGHSLGVILVHLWVEESQLYYPVVEQMLAGDFEKLPARGEMDCTADAVNLPSHAGALQMLTALYLRKIALLGSLSGAKWSLQARHFSLGEHTLQWWVERSLYHITWHLEQFPRTK